MSVVSLASLVYDLGGVRILQGHVLDALALLPERSIQTCATSPPYWNLRAYGTNPQVWGGSQDCDHQWDTEVRTFEQGNKRKPSDDGIAGRDRARDKAVPRQVQTASASCFRCHAWLGELGAEPTPEQFVANLVTVFRGVWRVLRDDGTVWINLGDSYAGSGRGPTGHNGIGDQERRQGFSSGYQRANGELSPGGRRSKTDAPPGLKAKDLIGIPWMIAFALRADGWYLRRDIIWQKVAPMPESVDDRPTTSHEYVFLLSKQAHYYYDNEAIREPPAQYERRGGDAAYAGSLGPQSDQPGAMLHQMAEHGRNRRSVWTINTEPYSVEMCTACKAIFEGAGKKAIKARMINGELVRICPKCKTTDKWLGHFATFPKKLVEPCILAGTSEKGGCAQCGAPWRRQIERTYENPGNRTTNGPRSTQNRAQTAGFATRLEARSQTSGWEPTCRCGVDEVVPQIVLDPFAGSGTTLYMARHHGRQSVGIELNPDYALLAIDRLKQGVLPL